jgi:hypothetical protein
MLGLDLSKDSARFQLALAVMFLITMLIRPLAMATLTGEMEDKDGKTKAMPMYIVIMILGIVSAGLFLFGSKVAALKGKQNLLALIAAAIAAVMYFLVFFGLKKANATAGIYTTATFDLISALALVAVLGMIYLEPSMEEKLGAGPAQFGHFYY